MRARRAALGLSQADLASAAGLSRQQVSAVESGRHSPSVTAALALGRVLDSSVEELFGPVASPRWEPVTGASPGRPAAVMAARVGDRAVFHPLPHQGAGPFGWRAPDGVYDSGDVRLFDTSVPEGAVIAGCDPVLGLVAELLPGAGPRRLIPIHATSVTAARALHRDRAHAALVHGTTERLAAKTPKSETWPIATWRIGLAAATRDRLDVDAIATGRLRIAHRPVGAEAERSLRAFLSRNGSSGSLEGPVAQGHIEAATCVELGSADVCLTIEPVAGAFGLEFLPIETHTVELRVDERWVDHPGIVSAIELFGSKRLAARIAHLEGYELLNR